MNAVYDFLEKYKFRNFLLECNYRSTKTIVDAAQSLIEHNNSPLKKKPFAHKPEGYPIYYYNVENSVQENNIIVKIIKSFKKKNMKYSDIAILYRTQFQSREVEDALLKNKIPYKITGGSPFYERKEIKDILSYILFAKNPRDIEAFKRIINVPKRGIGEKNKESILQFYWDYGTMGLEGDILDACREVKLSGKNREALDNFVSVIDTIRGDMEIVNPATLIERIVTLTNYQIYLESYDSESVDDRMDNIKELKNIAYSYSDLDEFIYSMFLNASDQLVDEEDTDSVNMMTMHASKGLEFPVVILIGASEGLSPHYRSIKEGDVSEERRLFYVGATRAESFLFIIHADKRKMFGQNMMYRHSRFLDEIDETYMKKL